MNTVKLDSRLAAAAAYIRPGSEVADVGCDHGYLAAFLVQTGRARQVYASDINEKPLHSAQETVLLYGVEDRVETVLSDGLRQIPHTVEDIVIAGMGGELIIEILDAAPWVFAPDKRLVLQPMSFAEKLRTHLYSRGMEICSETPVIDGRHTYCVLCAEYTGCTRSLSEYESVVGRLPELDSPLAREYLRRQHRKYQRILDGLMQSKNKDDLPRYQQLVRKLEQWKG